MNIIVVFTSCLDCTVGQGMCEGNICVCYVGFYGNKCDVDQFYCDEVSCGNNGVCKRLGDNGHICRCDEGRFDVDCGLDEVGCREIFCSGNGVCHTAITTSGTTCICDIGFYGDICQTP